LPATAGGILTDCLAITVGAASLARTTAELAIIATGIGASLFKAGLLEIERGSSRALNLSQ
jgi:hypothetical protein